MTISVTAQQTNMTLKTGTSGLELDTVSMSVIYRDENYTNYFSGNVILTPEDGITLQSTLADFETKAIEKAKNLITNATKLGDNTEETENE